jgi:hypothetical protein
VIVALSGTNTAAVDEHQIKVTRVTLICTRPPSSSVSAATIPHAAGFPHAGTCTREGVLSTTAGGARPICRRWATLPLLLNQ